jgi:hypothetical protein
MFANFIEPQGRILNKISFGMGQEPSRMGPRCCEPGLAIEITFVSVLSSAWDRTSSKH